ncbi:MAG TPA: glycosyltransferase family 4 protein [Solirubrobacteraceae bacterium]|nr:glycosyltransferase family 4 protein [Solirubrobacteraceae bacterium]
MSEQTAPPDDGAREGLLPPGFRARALRAQEDVLPEGAIVVTCDAPLGAGGLGRHLAEIAEAAARGGHDCATFDAGAVPARRRGRLWRLLSARTPVARSIATAERFDRGVAAGLPRADSLLAFNRQALAQFAAAGAAGYRHRGLVAASPHAALRAERHAAALRAYPIEESFAAQVPQRLLDEYARADAIYPASRYTLESFADRGFDPGRLPLFPLTPEPRFSPGTQRSDTFDIVYVGALSVAKGVPLLVDAFRGLDHDDLRLKLVGAPKTRPMRRWLDAALAADGRMTAAPGDPLPVLRAASLCVHPTYEDGFAYAPAEALACGVPALVSADTGMSELIERGVSGEVVATGDLVSLREAIDAAYRGDLVRGSR